MRKSKTLRQKLIKTNDDIFRQLIKIRDNNTCQKTFRKNVAIDVAHYWRRNILRTRWDFDNACCLQKGTHRFWAHSHFQEFREFWLKRLGQKKFDELEIKARFVAPVRTFDLMCIRQNLEKRLKDL